jgi:chromate transporter
MSQLDSPSVPQPGPSRVGLRDFLAYFLRLGALGFGGPIALAGHMQKDLVEERRWISPQAYFEGLAFSQLSPGPLAAQLAMYLGWVRAGSVGATLAGAVFILPSFVMVVVLAILYVHYGSLTWIQGIFYGVGAAVIGIIVRSAYKLIRATLHADWLLWILFAVIAVTTAWTESEIVWLFVLCGVVALAVKTPMRFWGRPASAMILSMPSWMTNGIHGVASTATLGTIFLFFLKAGAFVFGSGLAIVPFLYGGVVAQFHWLSERQFLDAVAVAMITPGPVVITAAFVGYLVGGPLGATLAALAVFAPPYLIVLLGAPYYRKFAQNRQVKAFVQGVTAAAVGAITGAAYILAKRAVVDLPTALIAAGTLAILLWTKKIPEPILILAAGIAGLLLFKGPH